MMRKVELGEVQQLGKLALKLRSTGFKLESLRY